MFNLNIQPKHKTVITVTHTAKPKTFTFSPQQGDKIIFFREDKNRFFVGIYMWRWQYRHGDNQIAQAFDVSPYPRECLPYCGTPDKQVHRVFVLDVNGEFSDYADLDLIGEYNEDMLAFAEEQNRGLALEEAIERLAAFGEVEAVA